VAEPAAQQLAKLQQQIETLQTRLQTTAKDLSLVSHILKWTDTTKSCPLQEFLASVETTAQVGNWSDEDMVRIASLKLADTI
jgi:hypothetical protein